MNCDSFSTLSLLVLTIIVIARLPFVSWACVNKHITTKWATTLNPFRALFITRIILICIFLFPTWYGLRWKCWVKSCFWKWMNYIFRGRISFYNVMRNYIYIFMKLLPFSYLPMNGQSSLLPPAINKWPLSLSLEKKWLVQASSECRDWLPKMKQK